MISPQATIAFLVLVAFTAMLLALMIKARTFVTNTRESLTFLALWMAIVFIITYDTECLVKGKCASYSWMRTVLLSILPIILIMMVIKQTRSGDGTKEESTQQ